MPHCRICGRNTRLCRCDDDDRPGVDAIRTDTRAKHATARKKRGPYGDIEDKRRPKNAWQKSRVSRPDRAKKKARSAVPQAICIGKEVNALRSGVIRTRTAFWNIQNFTSDLVRYGSSSSREAMSTDRNQVRLDFVADVILGMEVDSIVIMEMGSDAENVLSRLSDRLNRRDRSSFRWSHNISMDAGARVDPPENFEMRITKRAAIERRIWALPLILRHWNCAFAADDMSLAELRDAHLELVSHLGGSLPVVEQLDMSGVRIAAFELALAEDLNLLPQAAQDAHTALQRVYRSGFDGLDMSLRANLYAATLRMIFGGGRINVGTLQHDISGLDGPFHALRILGVLEGRYEKYGILRRRPPTESMLFHGLGRGQLFQPGSFANSRAPWAVNVPFGAAEQLPAKFIHSMWSATRGRAGGAGAGRSVMELRMDTLVEVARNGGDNPPVFIAGDTNVNGANVGTLNGRMAAEGYTRVGGTPLTTLRTEKTIRGLDIVTEDAILNEPYDAVYVRTDLLGTRYQVEMNCPSWDETALFEAFRKQMENSPAVQQWYLELLNQLYTPVILRLSRFRPSKSGKDSATVNVQAVLDAHKGAELTVDFMIKQQKRISKIAFDSVHNQRLANLFCGLKPYSMRVFYLFFRRFVSDHRLVCIDVAGAEHDGVIYKKGASKPPAPWSKTKGKVVAPMAPFAAEARDIVVPANPATGQVACLLQNYNTCGLRAAANARAGVFGAASNADLAALAGHYPALGGGGVPVDIGNFVDLADDDVARLANVGAGGANPIPVINNFLQYDAMINGDFPMDAGATRVAAYRAAVAAFIASGPAPGALSPELRLVFHTDAGRGLTTAAGVGHYFAARIWFDSTGAAYFQFAESLGAYDRRGLINDFIAFFLT